MEPTFAFRIWRLCFLNGSGRLTHPLYKHLFWRLYWRVQRRRVTGANPQRYERCEWCHDVKFTTVEEVWCRADPAGRLVRLCRDCASSCAGG